jgi:hypothetical protein
MPPRKKAKNAAAYKKRTQRRTIAKAAQHTNGDAPHRAIGNKNRWRGDHLGRS